MKASSPEPAVGDLRWFKSSYSAGDGGDCVEIADAGAAVLIRDSKRPDVAILSISAARWTAFVRMAGSGWEGYEGR